jgi:hypothetical protein
VRRESPLSRTGAWGDERAAESDRRFALLIAMIRDPRRWPKLRGRGRSAIIEGQEVAMSDERPIVTEANKDRIRQGVTGHNVRYVVIIGCALVIIAFVIIAVFMRP